MEGQLPAPRTHIDRVPSPPTDEPVEIEFTGWMPVNNRFGFCGSHPQFAHTQDAPAGYAFVCSREVDAPFSQPDKSPTPNPFDDPSLGVRLLKLLISPGYKLVSLVCNFVRHGPLRVMRTLAIGLSLLFRLILAGGRFLPSLRFVLSRHFSSQILLPRRPQLLFLTSVPYTYGQHPWVIEIEDPTTLFFPFIHNGKTASLRLEDSRFFTIVKTLLEAETCRGIITHIRSTAEALPRMFQSEVIARKVSYVPLGVSLPVLGERPDDGCLNLLFSSSWHQNPQSFYLRGGLEVLEAFDILQERYPHVRLTLRTKLPRLDKRYFQIMERCWVRVIHRFLGDEEMDSLMRETHLFLVPAARIHSVSVLKAMAYGQVVVASDGWGFDEYLDHGHNGIIVPGRQGKISWTDPDNGMLRENYRPMFTADPAVVENLVQALSTLVEDHDLRRRLGRQARHDVRTRFNLDNWNRGLKEALDRAVKS